MSAQPAREAQAPRTPGDPSPDSLPPELAALDALRMRARLLAELATATARYTERVVPTDLAAMFLPAISRHAGDAVELRDAIRDELETRKAVAAEAEAAEQLRP